MVERLTFDSFISQNYLFQAKVSEYIEPNYFEDANKKIEWQDAMKEEINALHKNDTLELVTRPIGKKSNRL